MSSHDKYKPDRPVFCGNFEYDANPRDVEKLFDKFGPVERVDMKTGFAFVFMKDKRDGDDAIRAIDGTEFGLRRRRLRVEWAKGDGDVKRREDTRRKVTKANETLFVVNFDPETTRERDLEHHFSPYGRLRRVQIKRNYGFIQYEAIEDATEALKACNHSRLMGRTITVEYVAREADGRAQTLPGMDDSHRREPPSRRRRSPSYDRGHERSGRYERRRRTPSSSLSRSTSRDRRRDRDDHRGDGRRGDRRRDSRSPSPLGDRNGRAADSRSPSPRREPRRSPAEEAPRDASMEPAARPGSISPEPERQEKDDAPPADGSP